MPRRVRVEGDLFHGQVPDGAVYVGRAAPGLKRSPFHNPHPVGKPCKPCSGVVHDVTESLALYCDHLGADLDLLDRAVRELAGRDLACWCPLPEPGEQDACHGEVLLTLANTPPAPARFAPGRMWRETVDVPTGGLL